MTGLLTKARYTNISAHNYYISPSLHHVLLTELSPSTTYYYTVGDPDVSVSAVFSFKTPQPTGFKSFPQTLGAECGINPPWAAAAARPCMPETMLLLDICRRHR